LCRSETARSPAAGLAVERDVEDPVRVGVLDEGRRDERG
jgi:hypothetical protein